LFIYCLSGAVNTLLGIAVFSGGLVYAGPCCIFSFLFILRLHWIYRWCLRYVFVHNLDVKDMSVRGKVPCILDYSVSHRRV